MKKSLKLLVFITLLFLTKEAIKAEQYIWPIEQKNAYETRIEYGYGKRQYNSKSYDMLYNYQPYEGVYSNYENHYGVDIAGIKGNTYNVVSVSDGTVLTTSLDQIINPSISYIDRNQRRSTTDGGGYGNYIVIKENSTGLCFLYGHLKANSITLKKGDTVKAGDIIGVMGSSGDSGHMHLHFEVRLNQNYTTWGKNLIVTTAYGLETLNPTNFIGTTSPEKPIIETIEIPEEKIGEAFNAKKEETINGINKIEEKTNRLFEIIKDDTKAQVKSIEYNDLNTFGKITVTLDKNTTVAPVLTLKISSETIYPNLISKNNNTYTYTIKYNELNVVTYGYINAIIEENSQIEGITEVIGYLNETIIPQTYEDSYYYKTGDLNEDGFIDSRDASIVLRISSKLSTGKDLTIEEKEQSTRADMNKDGYINQKDASLILSYYSNRSTGLTDEKQERIINCDVTKDHVVSMSDYYIVLNEVYLGVYNAEYDLNKDNELNQSDIEYFKDTLRQYGKR